MTPAYEVPPPVSLPPRRPRPRIPNPTLPAPCVQFDRHRRLWNCYCRKSGQVWCKHVQSYWADRGEVADLRNAGEGVFQYQLARGMVNVAIRIDKYPREDAPGYERRMWFNEDIGLWMDEDTAGIDILDQLVVIVSHSQYMKYWTNCVFTYGRMDRGYSCRNKFHDYRNSKQITEMIQNMSNVPEDLEALVFANAYYELFEGRCLSCKTSVNFANDIPSL